MLIYFNLMMLKTSIQACFIAHEILHCGAMNRINLQT